MRHILLLLLLLGAACREDPRVVLPERLALGDGGMAVNDLPALDVVVRMTRDSTNFNPFDLMQMIVNGENEAFSPAMVIGGDWAVYTVPAPGNDAFSIRLTRRTGAFIDDFNWVTVPYTGPTITAVAPDTAMVGTQVTISGTGFDQGALRVFFGGAEGTVDASTATSITATVPADALPGLVWVLIGNDAPSGLVGFQPLDDLGVDVPKPTAIHVTLLYPGSGPTEAVIRVYGFNLSQNELAQFDGAFGSRVLNRVLLTVEPIGDIVSVFAVPFGSTPTGDVAFRLTNGGVNSNELPYTLEE